MVVMSMAVYQNFDVRETKAKFGNILFDLWNCFEQPAIEKNVTVGSRNQERTDFGCTDVVNVPDDPVRLDWLVPLPTLFICLSMSGNGSEHAK